MSSYKTSEAFLTDYQVHSTGNSIFYWIFFTVDRKEKAIIEKSHYFYFKIIWGNVKQDHLVRCFDWCQSMTPKRLFSNPVNSSLIFIFISRYENETLRRAGRDVVGRDVIGQCDVAGSRNGRSGSRVSDLQPPTLSGPTWSDHGFQDSAVHPIQRCTIPGQFW